MDSDDGLTWAINVVANELGRMPRESKRSDYGRGAFDAVERVLKRLMSCNGEAIHADPASTLALIPSLADLNDHSRAIRLWKSGDMTDGIYKQAGPALAS